MEPGKRGAGEAEGAPAFPEEAGVACPVGMRGEPQPGRWERQGTASPWEDARPLFSTGLRAGEQGREGGSVGGVVSTGHDLVSSTARLAEHEVTRDPEDRGSPHPAGRVLPGGRGEGRGGPSCQRRRC